MIRALFLLAFTLSVGLFAGMEYDLRFSLDEGKSWQESFPVLTGGRRQVWMRVVGRVVGEEQDYIVNKRMDSRLMCKKNFASARHGKAKWLADTVFVQFADQGKYDSRRPFELLYKMDFSQREAIADPKKEIPAAQRWENGVYALQMLLHYTLRPNPQEKMQVVVDKVTIIVTIED